MTKDEAMKIRESIEMGSAALPDMEASLEPTLARGMHYDGELIKAGVRINWNGVLKRAAVDLWDTEANTPDAAPSLWEDIEYKEGVRIIPETITASAAFDKNELGWWNAVLYISLIDANVWNPDTNPAGWAIYSAE
jgi:hypothetical protein